MSRLLSLTEREKELCSWFKKGLGYRETGEQMGIKTGTVANAAQNIRRKLQVDGKLSLRMAIKAGLDV